MSEGITISTLTEGVDIPEVNQVIMLRPTMSPIVFVQQLGRGLRKFENKEYVVILDFIGNYKNNFMIPIALSGDRTYNKDTIRRYVMEGERVIPGSSTIHFDEIASKQIFSSIDKMSVRLKDLKDKYKALKNRLGRIPSILDFYDYGEVDPIILIEYAGSYVRFLQKADKEYDPGFSPNEDLMLAYVSSMILNGKRIHELLILQLILKGEKLDEVEFSKEMRLLGEDYRREDYESACRVLDMDFINSSSDKKKYSDIRIIEPENQDGSEDKQGYRLMSYQLGFMSKEFKEELAREVEYGLRRYRNKYKNHDETNLVLYEKYSRKDVCRILNWEKDDSSTVYGYRIKYGTCPIFVTYEKKEDITSSTKYEDQFINPDEFSWMTRSRVTRESREAQQIINYRSNGLKIFLFIKKSDDEGADFYYMGKVTPASDEQTVIMDDNGKELPIMNFRMRMDKPVREDIYEYIVS